MSFQFDPVMVPPPWYDGEGVGPLGASLQSAIDRNPLSGGIEHDVEFDLRPLVHLQPQQDLGNVLFVRAVLVPVGKLRHPVKGALQGRFLRRVLDVPGDPDFPVLVQHIQVSPAAGKVGGLGGVLDVPRPPLGVVYIQEIVSILIGHGDIVFETI